VWRADRYNQRIQMLDVAGHLAFALILLSFLVRDIVWLRALSIAASIASITYNYFAPARPLMLVIGWNIVFILVNIIQIALLFRERRGVEFSDEEKEVYETSFSRLSPVEFMRLLRAGEWRDVAAGTLLVDAGAVDANVLLIYTGSAVVEKNNRMITQLRAGDFIGELGFVTRQPAAARVTATEPTRLLTWSRAGLQRLLDRNPSMRATLHAELSDDMARKLSRRTGATGQFEPPRLPSV
jgi:CRP-like cAMP-binding protein